MLRQIVDPPRTTSWLNPNADIPSQASPEDSRAQRSGGKRVVTLSKDSHGVLFLRGTDTADPTFLEMQKGLFLDVGNVLEEFANLDRGVRSFCDRCGGYIGRTKQLPRISPPPQPVPKNSPINKSPEDFPTVEDYVYFMLLSIINSHLYRDIFQPFHPASSIEENKRYEEQYERKIDTCEYLLLPRLEYISNLVDLAGNDSVTGSIRRVESQNVLGDRV